MRERTGRIPEPPWLTQGPEPAPSLPEHCPICGERLADGERVDADSICALCERELAEQRERVQAMLANPRPQCSGVEYPPAGVRRRYRQLCGSTR